MPSICVYLKVEIHGPYNHSDSDLKGLKFSVNDLQCMYFTTVNKFSFDFEGLCARTETRIIQLIISQHFKISLVQMCTTIAAAKFRR